MLQMTDLNLHEKKVLIREDFNVPIHNNQITNQARLRAAVPTIQHALQQNAAVILLSHLGRPTEGEYQEKYSLAPVATLLAEILSQPVKFIQNWQEGVAVAPGEVALCENIRFVKGETENDIQLAKKLASLCDIFVMDAFATAHRAHASTAGVAYYAPVACAGPLLMQEITELDKIRKNPSRPLVAVVGGSKVSTKFELLQSLLEQVDCLIVGGGIANTFLAAQGYPVADSLFEVDFLRQAQALLDTAHQQKKQLPLPIDVVVAETLDNTAKAVVKPISEVRGKEKILDIGPQTIERYQLYLKSAKSILWNGPVGVFEIPAFAKGTQAVAQAIADSNAYSVAGGGDTIAAIEQFAVQQSISYISTGGGAFLEYIQGIALPALEMLRQRS